MYSKLNIRSREETECSDTKLDADTRRIPRVNNTFYVPSIQIYWHLAKQ